MIIGLALLAALLGFFLWFVATHTDTGGGGMLGFHSGTPEAAARHHMAGEYPAINLVLA